MALEVFVEGDYGIVLGLNMLLGMVQVASWVLFDV
jgi:hypothetical protein